MRVATILLALAAAYCSPPALAQTAGIRVAPILIQMTPEHPLSSFRLHNGRDHETAFQAEVFAWSQENGRDVLMPTDAMIVAPSTFLAPAGADQIIRLGLRPHTALADQEQSFRLVLREIPSNDALVNGFRLVVEMSMPVFVTPRSAHGVLMATSAAHDLTLSNTGDGHLQLSPLNPDVVPDLPRYLLAGATATRPLQSRADTLQLMIAGASATPQTQTIALEHAAPILADAR